MNFVSLEKCRELYELSKWGSKLNEFDHIWGVDSEDKSAVITSNEYASGKEKIGIPNQVFPAYTGGELLLKIPKTFDGYYFDLSVTKNGNWIVEYFTNDYTPDRPIGKFQCESELPDEAIAELCIKLFKEGILK